MGDTAVPVLPTHDLARTLDFYGVLGYTITHEQTRPYVYGAVTAHDCELHFTAAPAGDGPPEQTRCLIMVEDVADRHRGFSAAIRERFGKIPAQGPGRITRFRSGQTRFSLIDPDGNRLIYIEQTEPEHLEYGGSAQLTGLARVLDIARILRDSKNDDKAAERALESGLRRHGAEAGPLDRARAFAALAELAVARENPKKAAERRADLVALALTEAERAELAAELGAADDLEDWLQPRAE
ncbi:glyoxalase [Nocardia sp. NBC_01329]|uniref:glyoxalase n=1 Tax=Nocardia sp. NBC_01329 TaxID=2903594 RepID=UPI002E1456E0|nr:glyoxalase [Nocardia sp. NBC_01329]